MNKYLAATLATGIVLALSGAAAAQQKTAKACNNEYKSNKPAIQAAKELKKDFVAACRALTVGTPTPIGAAAPVPAPAPAPTPQPAPAPTPPPAPTAPAPRSQAPAAPGASACGDGGYAHLPAKPTAIQFCAETQARARCPGAPVVWVNTKSKVYHLPGQRNYGHTKEGAYECQSDATAEGDRPTRNGQ